MSEETITEKLIIKKWKEHHFSEKMKGFDGVVSLDTNSMKCLKDSFKSSIWKLNVQSGGKSRPIILKVFKSMRIKREESLIELNIYRKARNIFTDDMPQIYLTYSRVTSDDSWVFMEYVEKIEGQVVFTPSHFDLIIPALAKLHARTYNDKFNKHRDVFIPWLPRYNSRTMSKRRKETNAQTKFYLNAAMQRSDLKKILTPSYSLLHKLLNKGPIYFPELLEAGMSIVHRDLQTRNMGCNNVNKQQWHIKFIDWEGAGYEPCWFDVISLVGVFLGYRSDWRTNEEAIIQHCSQLYADEMKKHGIVFKTNPTKLYKMAYLQLILEEYLYYQLSWEVDGRKKAILLPYFLQKINVWGKELKLY